MRKIHVNATAKKKQTKKWEYPQKNDSLPRPVPWRWGGWSSRLVTRQPFKFFFSNYFTAIFSFKLTTRTTKSVSHTARFAIVPGAHFPFANLPLAGADIAVPIPVVPVPIGPLLLPVVAFVRRPLALTGPVVVPLPLPRTVIVTLTLTRPLHVIVRPTRTVTISFPVATPRTFTTPPTVPVTWSRTICQNFGQKIYVKKFVSTAGRMETTRRMNGLPLRDP